MVLLTIISELKRSIGNENQRAMKPTYVSIQSPSSVYIMAILCISSEIYNTLMCWSSPFGFQFLMVYSLEGAVPTPSLWNSLIEEDQGAFVSSAVHKPRVVTQVWHGADLWPCKHCTLGDDMLNSWRVEEQLSMPPTNMINTQCKRKEVPLRGLIKHTLCSVPNKRKQALPGAVRPGGCCSLDILYDFPGVALRTVAKN